ncbi:hypothetical protein C0989_004765 [Termitomyces sp. Mn162]|nr:hypothetical protein C0989_004765 [Termitomyces sp. Mn162]
MGFKFSRACAFDHRGLPLQAGGGSNGGIDSTGGGAPMGKGGLRRGAGGEGGIQAGAEHLGVGGNGASVGGAGFTGASDAARGVACRGGGGAGDGTREWFTAGRVGGSEAEGGLVGQQGRLGAHGDPPLGVGAPSPLGWCLCGICVNPRWVGAGVHGSASRVAAGDSEGWEVVGGALAA